MPTDELLVKTQAVRQEVQADVLQLNTLFTGDANAQIDLTKAVENKAWLLEQETNAKIFNAQEASAEVLAEQQVESAAADAPSLSTHVVDEAKREVKLEAVSHAAEKIKEVMDPKSPAVGKAGEKFAAELKADAGALVKEGEKLALEVGSKVIAGLSKMGGG